MKTQPFTTCIISVLLLTASLAMAADWPQWRGPSRTGISSEKITWPASGPKQLWKASVGMGYSSVSVSKGRAYTMGNADGQDTVWCLDANTGRVIWKYSYPCNSPKEYPGPRTTPTVDGNFVYTVSRNGNLMALDAVKGTLVWSADYVKDFGAKTTRWGFAGSPLVDGDLLLVNAGGVGASVVAFDKTTGKMVWKSGDDAAGYSSPVIFTLGAQRLVAMFSGAGLFAFNLADGNQLWKTGWETHSNTNVTDPIVFGDKIWISSGYRVGCCLLKVTPSSATEVYSNKKFVSHFANPVLIGDALYGITGQTGRSNDKPVLICYYPNTGDVKWKKSEIGANGVIAAGNILLIQSATGSLIAAEATPEAYKEIGHAPVLTGQCLIAPSLANGLVYCRNTEGDVVCLGLGGRQ